MKTLSLGVAICGVVALLLAITGQDVSMAGFGVAALICSLTTYRSTEISSFLQIFVTIFSAETVVFGVATLAARGGLWPAAYAQYMLPESLALTVAIFSIGVYLVSHAAVVRQITCIADLYFDASEHGQARIPPLRPITALERHIAAAMIVCLVLINQTQVGIMVRLSFFNRDWFDAIQNRDAAGFWQLLLFGLRPGVHIRNHRGCRVRCSQCSLSAGALAHRSLHGALAERSHALPHESHWR
jgi:putative ATP-binding cassette transporter